MQALSHNLTEECGIKASARELGGAFLKTLSMCFWGAWSVIWSLRLLWRKAIVILGRKLRYLTTAEHFLFCETGSFGKASFSPLFYSSLVALVAATGAASGVKDQRSEF